MAQSDLFERSPDARTAVESSESTTEAIFRAADRAGVDPLARDDRLHDVVDGDAVDQLFSTAGSDSGSAETRLVLDLWDRIFVVTAFEVRVYR